jgi:hypothetical protein
VTEYRLVAEPRVELDVVRRTGGTAFLEQLFATYDRIAAGPLQDQDLRSGIRRALLRRFPYAVYFAVAVIASSSSRFSTRLVIGTMAVAR